MAKSLSNKHFGKSSKCIDFMKGFRNKISYRAVQVVVDYMVYSLEADKESLEPGPPCTRQNSISLHSPYRSRISLRSDECTCGLGWR